ncbi:MAG TPA: hypothetical protein VKE22_11935, partial [Haliangiales bacterium]|nr:hypothetical protein [Haliangiales bacterium]
RARLDVMQDKLPAFPAGLPARVVAPLEPAVEAGRIVGYTMPLVAPAEPLAALAAPPARANAVLRDLLATLAALHARGVVVGDLNDFNVLVDAAGAARLIDADSFAYGRWGCPTFTERFVDPLVCDPGALVPVRAHGPGSDAYAFAVMALQALLGVGPYGGVAPGVPAAARPLRRLTIFDARVRYPRGARPLEALPDELLHHMYGVFVRDRRGPFPDRLLALDWRTCPGCGLDHARRACPRCGGAPRPRPDVIVRGTVTARRVPALPPPLEAAPRLWLQGEQIWRQGAFGAEPIGDVLGGHTRLWVGAALGFGFWRAAGYLVAFVFHPRRRGLNDGVRLPMLDGADVARADVALSADRAWLTCVVRRGPRVEHACIAVDAAGRVLGHAAGPTWVAEIGGACAAGPYLFIPTDDGVVRVEPDGAGGLAVTATYPDTAPFVTAKSRLAVTREGLGVETGADAFVLHIAKEATP